MTETQDQFIHQGAFVRVAGEQAPSRVLATWQGTVTLFEGSEDILNDVGRKIGMCCKTREVPASLCTIVKP